MITSGTSLLHYRVVEKIGEGGMGAVWRATDATLDRDVAIKVLPADFASDAERLARFEREAKVLASLNHPHIGAIYGFHEAEGVRFLAMELVPGEDLEERLKKGSVPVSDAVDIARQIAAGLEYAHERGIVHRDLKPANVKISPDGTVKVLDFGLAKAVVGEASGPSPTSTPTILPTMTSAGTAIGMILGTAAYMSPEQARGKPVDKRADIWAFGVVLFEMLAGTRLFEGETVSDTLAAVLRQDIDRARLPAETPESVRRLIERCLDRDPRTRLRDIGEARVSLSAPVSERPEQASSPVASSRSRWRAGLVWLVAGAVVGAGLAVFLLRTGAPPPGDRPPAVTLQRMTQVPGPETQPDISPDGREILYSSAVTGHSDIYLLRVGGARAIDLTPGSGSDDEQARFSPSGDQIAFRSSRDGGGLFVMGATGESVRRLTKEGFDPEWSPDGRFIAYSTEGVLDPYSRVYVAALWTLEIATGKTTKIYAGDAVQPAWSPDGSRIAFWANSGGQRDIWTIAATGGPTLAVTSDAPTDWSPEWSPDGRWLYFESDRDGSMNVWRVPIDQRSGRVQGDPQPVTNGIRSLGFGRLSADGTRMVVMGYDRTNDITVANFDPANPERIVPRTTLRNQTFGYCDPSPDGAFLACSSLGAQEDVLVVRSDGAETRRLMDDAFKDRAPTWSPDGKVLAFMSTRSGRWESWAIQADGSGLRQLTNFDKDTFMVAWSPDGKSAIVGSISTKGVWRIDTSRLNTQQSAEALDDPAKASFLDVLSWSPSGKLLAGRVYTESQAGIPAVWDLAGKSLRKLDVLELGGNGISFLPDSRHVLFNSGTGIILADLVAGTSRRLGNSLPTDDCRLSRDGRTLLIQHPVFDSDIWLMEFVK
jgi:eukaryotic-like serine/threonine-protein kinase